MVEVRTGGWGELGDAARRIRTEVFMQEQRIPAEMEWDDADASAIHAVAFNRLGQAVATGRLLQERPGVARIGRMAVHRMLRGSGVGRQVLQTLLAAAAGRGDREAVLQCPAQRTGVLQRPGLPAARAKHSMKRASPTSRWRGHCRSPDRWPARKDSARTRFPAATRTPRGRARGQGHAVRRFDRADPRPVRRRPGSSCRSSSRAPARWRSWRSSCSWRRPWVCPTRRCCRTP